MGSKFPKWEKRNKKNLNIIWLSIEKELS